MTKTTTIKGSFPQIYKVDQNGSVSFMVSARSKKRGLNIRKFFTSETKAREFIKEFEKTLHEHGAVAINRNLAVSDSKVAQMVERLTLWGKTLEDAVNHYVHYLGEKAKTDLIPPIVTLVETWRSDKANSKIKPISHRTKIELKSYAKWIGLTFGKYRPNDVDKKMVESALNKLNVGNTSHKQYRRYLRMFFIWAKAHRYATFNPTDGVVIKSDIKEVQIYSPDQIKEVLTLAQTDKFKPLLGFYVLCTFLGLRPTEAERAEWSHINFQTKEIYVTKGKTPARRFKMNDTAISWLKHFQTVMPENSPLNPTVAHENLQQEFRDSVSFEWIQDGLRHTFGTNRWNELKNIAEVVFEMGNSVTIAKRHYCRELEQRAVQSFWGLLPPADAQKK